MVSGRVRVVKRRYRKGGRSDGTRSDKNVEVSEDMVAKNTSQMQIGYWNQGRMPTARD